MIVFINSTRNDKYDRVSQMTQTIVISTQPGLHHRAGDPCPQPGSQFCGIKSTLACCCRTKIGEEIRQRKISRKVIIDHRHHFLFSFFSSLVCLDNIIDEPHTHTPNGETRDTNPNKSEIYQRPVTFWTDSLPFVVVCS